MSLSLITCNQNIEKNVTLCYMNIDSFKDYVKTVAIYVDIAKDFETQFDTSIYELDRS